MQVHTRYVPSLRVPAGGAGTYAPTCAGFLPTLRAMSCTSGARSSAGTSRLCSMYAVAGQDEAITWMPCAAVHAAAVKGGVP